nr:YHS domain-containing protein [Acidovorax sp. JG5]
MKDPVCGMSVTSQSPHQAMHDDHHYRFCSTHCRDKFIADPVRYRVSEAPVGT